MSKSKQKFDPVIHNFYDRLKNQTKYYNPHPEMLQHPFRLIIVGGSGSMKTNSLLNIVEKSQCFTKIYLITKMMDEPLYEYLSDCLEGMESLDGTPLLEKSNKLEDLPELNDDMKSQQNLVIIDDMICEKKKKLEEKVGDYYIRARKYSCSVVFISQIWFSIPKIMRLNSNYVIFKKIELKKDRQLIESDLGLPKKLNLLEMADHLPEENFILIDKKTRQSDMKYRVNFEPINTNDI